MKKNTLILLFVICSMGIPKMFSQATFTANPSDITILNELEGPGLVLSNSALEYGSRNFQFATFSNGNAGANFSVDTGVMMTTGSASQAFGSNGTAAFPSNSGLEASTTVGLPTYSDPDIIAIDGGAIYDVAVFSFDVTLDPGLTAIQIIYQFGSDEYPDYVGTTFNDVFGFFVSGPGITGTQNIARVPGTDNPVAVNTVNGGYLGCQQPSFPSAGTVDISQSSQFIINGHNVVAPPGPAGSCNTNSGAFTVFTEYNGITKQFIGTINGLTPGVTYRFKMAIADTGDESLDSAVFINQLIGTMDIDGDGSSDQTDLDDDNDGILDTLENTLGADPSGDPDLDGILNYQDANNNGTATPPVCTDGNLDGICDTLDPVFDSDGDQISDHLDLDSDNDGIYDVAEVGGTDANNDGEADGAPGNTPTTNGIPATAGTGITPTETTVGTPDHLNLDSDNDGCSDANEAYSNPNADGGDTGVYGTDPADPSTIVDTRGRVTSAAYTGTTPDVTDVNIVTTCINALGDGNSALVVEGVGGVAVNNILSNDIVGGGAATTANVDITEVTPASNPGVTLNTATGSVNVTAAVPSGNYTIEYQICEKGLSAPCTIATITVFVENDADNDGIGDSADLDDDNDGILDDSECIYALTAISGTGGTYTLEFENMGSVALQSPNNDAPGWLGANASPAIFDNDAEFTIQKSTGTLAGFNRWYSNTGATLGAAGVDFDFTFPTNQVTEFYLHINSLDQFRITFDDAENPNVRWELVNSNTETSNTASDPNDFNLGDLDPSDKDTNAAAETVDGPGGLSADFTIRFYPINGNIHLSTINLMHIEQPGRIIAGEGWQITAEAIWDTDGDGLSNCLDLDSENDGIYDAVEAGHGQSHTNGVVNGALGTDGIPDAVQGTSGPNSGAVDYTLADSETTPDGIADFLELDSDGDSCTDANEAYNNTTADGGDTGVYGVDPADPTTIVDVNGRVTAATYTVPVNIDSGAPINNTQFDFQQSGSTPAIATAGDQPQNVLTNGSSPDTFTVNATGVLLSYQWQVDDQSGGGFVDIDPANGTDIYTGSDTATLTLTGVTATENGYQYRVLISDGTYICNETTSSIATLTFDDTAVIAITTPIEVDDIVNGTEATDVTISGTTTDVEAGQTVTVTFSDGVNPDVTTTATVQADGSWTATDADISSLDDGAITVDADVSDVAGNAATTQESVTLDTAAAIAITTPIEVDDIVNGTEAGDVSISGTTTDIEAGQTVTVTFSDGVNPDVTTTVTVQADGSWTATDADISGLDEGTITVDADVSDVAGNAATTQESVTLDTTAAIAITTPIEIDDIVNNAESGDVTISGTTTDVEAGQTVTVTFSDGVNPDVTTTATVQADGSWTATDADISGLDEGTITVDADVSDVAGNAATTQESVDLDITPGTIAITTPIEVDDVVNGTEAADVTTSGTTTDIEAGQTVTVTFSDGVNPDVTTTATVQADGSWTATDVDISSLDDGAITVDADVNDVAGNPSTTQESVTLDTTATIAITTPIEVDDIVNGTEVGDVSISSTTTDVEAGQTVTVTFSDGVNPDVTTTATVQADGSWTATDVDISSLDEGAITVDADVSDVAGNAATVQESVTLDTTAAIAITTPIEVDDIVNGTEVGDVSISGTTTDVEAGQTVTVTFSDGVNPDVTTTATVQADGSWTATDADISNLDDGAITVDADVSDVAGNAATTQESVTLDTAAAIVITTPIEVNDIVNGTESGDVTISGTTTDVEAGQTVTVTFSDGVNPDVTTTATVQADGSWTATDVDISSLDDGAITVDADVSDVAGNAATTQESVTLDTTAAIAITTPIEVDDIVNGTEAGDVTISGTTTDVEAGQTVTVTISDGVNPDVTTTATVQADGSWTATDAYISGLDEGTITVDADVSDVVGNAATTQESVTLDTSAAIAITTPIEADDIVNGIEAGDVTISGTTTDVEAGQTVTVTFSDGVNPDVTTTAAIQADGSWTATDADISSLDDGTITIDADVSDVAGNPATTQESVILDTSATIAITTPIEVDDIVNGTEVSDVSISGTTTDVEAGQTVTVTFSDGVAPDVTTTATIQADGSWTATDVDISSLDDGAITVDADVSDVAGNAATTQEPVTLDTTAAIAINTPIEIDDIVNAGEVSDVTISGTTTDIEAGQTVTVTFSDGVNPDVTTTATVQADGSWTATDADISSLDDGTITIDADVSDVAGNPATTQESVILDDTIAIIITTPIEIDDIVNGTEVTDVTISGTTIDVEAGQTVTVTFSDGVNPDVTTTAIVQADGSWTATDADISSLDDGSIMVDADVSDTVGNTANDQATVILDVTSGISLDTPIEGDDMINANEAGDVSISGTTTDIEAGQTVTVTFSDGVNPDVTTTVTVQADGSWTATNIDLSGLNSGSITVDVSSSDIAGNMINTQQAIILDQIIPTVDTTLSNDLTPVLTGTAEPNDTITVSVDADGDGIANVTYTVIADADGNWSIDPDTAIPDSGNFPVLTDQQVIDVTATDPAGNINIGMIQIDLTDTDEDGINDLEEEADGTDPLDPCDPDPLAVGSADCDNDGISNEFEIGDDLDNPRDTDGDGIPDLLDDDDDGDGILTSDENADPNGDGNPDDAFDSDGDGTPDYLEEDNTNAEAEDGIEVFNALTPNGDGDHDVFVISNIEKFPENELKIFNRWGVLVYEAKGYGQDGEYFTGESKGRTTINAEKLLPVGTYFYILLYTNENGVTKKRSDYLYLNR